MEAYTMRETYTSGTAGNNFISAIHFMRGSVAQRRAVTHCAHRAAGCQRTTSTAPTNAIPRCTACGALPRPSVKAISLPDRSTAWAHTNCWWCWECRLCIIKALRRTCGCCSKSELRPSTAMRHCLMLPVPEVLRLGMSCEADPAYRLALRRAATIQLKFNPSISKLQMVKLLWGFPALLRMTCVS